MVLQLAFHNFKPAPPQVPESQAGLYAQGEKLPTPEWELCFH